MPETSSFIDELERALATGTATRRQRALDHVLDLFVSGSSHFSDRQIAVFDEVLLRLTATIEAEVRTRLAQRLAPLPDAPPQIIHALAFDDVVAVAAPVLSTSERLDEAALIENASTKSQGHLYAIAQRKTLSEAVTDVLVERGDRRVVRSVAKNAGARFSDSGFGKLVARARGDETLAKYVGARTDMPRHHFLKLLSTASSSVRQVLEATNPEAAGTVQQLITDITDNIRREVRDASRDHAKAKADAKRRYNNCQLAERDVHARARAQKFEETVVALALLGHFPVELVERALLDEGTDMVLILAKAAGCSRTTTKTILLMHAADRGLSPQDLDAALASYDRLSPATAKRVLDFYTERRKGSDVETLTSAAA